MIIKKLFMTKKKDVKLVITVEGDSVNIRLEGKSALEITKKELSNMLATALGGIALLAFNENILNDIIEDIARNANMNVSDLLNAILQDPKINSQLRQPIEVERMYG